jgi:ubiquinone/menaquinone biosynthesis C-methylase UbiE
MVSEAARLNPQATFRLAAAESLPFPDQTADAVMTSLSFHHWSNQAKGLQEIARVLRPGGLFCLADHRLNLFRERVRNRKQIQALIIAAGLAVRKQRGMGMGLVLVTIAGKAGSQ